MRVHETVVLSESALADLARTYALLPAPLRAVDPRVLTEAMRLAHGNEHRITADDDGSLTVWNYPVW